MFFSEILCNVFSETLGILRGHRRGSPISSVTFSIGSRSYIYTKRGTRFCANISIRYLYVTTDCSQLSVGGCCWLVEGETYLSQSERTNESLVSVIFPLSRTQQQQSSSVPQTFYWSNKG